MEKFRIADSIKFRNTEPPTPYLGFVPKKQFFSASLIPTRGFDFVYTVMMVSVNGMRMRSSSWGCPGGGYHISIRLNLRHGHHCIWKSPPCPACCVHLKCIPIASILFALCTLRNCCFASNIYRKCCFNFDFMKITSQINSLLYFHCLHCLPCLHSRIFA